MNVWFVFIIREVMLKNAAKQSRKYTLLTWVCFMTAPRKRWILSPIRTLMMQAWKRGYVSMCPDYACFLPQCTGGIWTLRTTLRTTLRRKKLCFLRLGRPSVHNKLSRKQSFQKTLFKPEEFGIAAFPFLCGQKTLRKRKFSKATRLWYSRYFPAQFLLKTQIQIDRRLLLF